jgi:vitamin B12 transporter
VTADAEARADFVLRRSVQQLDEVVTTGTLIETERKALPTPISVFTEEDIRERGIQRVAQIFRGEIPGLVSPTFGADDEQVIANTRGSGRLDGFGSMKVYVDGVAISEPIFLSTISAGSIERVEVLRGPQASTLYGSGALSGVIQIFTKKGGRTQRPVFQGQILAGAMQSQHAPDGAAPMYQGSLDLSGVV